MDKVVVCRSAILGQLAGDGADAVLRAVEVHERVAAGDVGAEARNAADIASAGDLALGVAVAHSALGHADDTADVIARRALRRAVALAAADDAQLRRAADAARVVLAGHGAAVVRGVNKHALGEVLRGQRAFGHDVGIALRIEIILDRHGARNAAGVDVAVSLAVVFAIVNLAVGGVCNVLLGHVLQDILAARIERQLQNVAQIHHNDIELVVDRLHIVDDLNAVSGRLHAQAGQAAGDTAEVVEHTLHRGAEVAADARQGQRAVAGEILRHLIEIAHAGGQMAGGLLHLGERVLELYAHIVEPGVAVLVLGEVVDVDDLRHGGDVAGDRAGGFRSVARALEQGVALGLISRQIVRVVLIAVLVGHFLPVLRALRFEIVVAGAIGIGDDLHEPCAVVHGGVELLGRDGEVIGRVLERFLVHRRHLVNNVEIVKAAAEVADRAVERAGALREFGDCGGEHFLRRVDAEHHFVDRAGRFVHILGRLLRNVARVLRRAGSRIADRAERGRHCAGGGARVVEQRVHQIMQALQIARHLRGGACAHVERDVRLHLADDTAHVLAAVSRAPVRAAGYQSALAADDAADVVADVLEADIAPVRAANDDAGGEAHDAAHVCGGVGLFRLFLVVRIIRDAGKRQIIQALRGRDGRVAGVDVHARGVRAVGNGSEVLADNAADIMVARNVALGLAVVDHAGGFVRARDAADVACAADRAGERAAGDRAHVGADDRADLTHRACGIDVARHLQVLDRAALLHIAEQTHMRAVAVQRQAADRVTLPVKRAAEGRDRHIVRPGQVDVAIQNNRLFSGIRIIFTGLAQFEQILDRRDVDRVLIRRGRACAAEEAQYHCQKERNGTASVSFHWNPPCLEHPVPSRKAARQCLSRRAAPPFRPLRCRSMR